MIAQPSLEVQRGRFVRTGRRRRPGLRSECVATFVALRLGIGRGLAALKVADPAGATDGEYFIPFTIKEMPSLHERDFGYAGLIAALDRLHTLDVSRVLIQIDDAELVDELERRIDPPRELALPYIILGCKLNEFAQALVVAVQPARLDDLRAKASSLGAALSAGAVDLAG